MACSVLATARGSAAVWEGRGGEVGRRTVLNVILRDVDIIL